MKNAFYYLGAALLLSIGLASAQSTCASIVRNIGFEKKAGNIEYVTKLNATTALFYGEDQYYGHELWRTDGTLQGTTLVKDIAVGTSSSRGSYTNDLAGTAAANKPVVLNGIMYFEATDGKHNYEVWRSDGTLNGTFMLGDLNTDNRLDQVEQYYRSFHVYNNEVYFWGGNSEVVRYRDQEIGIGNQFRLYKTKGTPETTVLVGEFASYQSTYIPPPLVEYNGSLAFVLKTPSTSTRKSKSIYYQIDKSNNITQAELHPDGIINLGIANGQIYFSNSKGLFKSDGTTNGTVLIRENGSSFSASLIENTFWGDGKLVYFIGPGGLWRTDGTMTGTYSIKNSVALSVDSKSIFVYKNELYFVDFLSKNGNSEGYRLWKTDGTVAGTVPVVDIDSENKGYQKYIRLITEIDGDLYFYGKIDGVTAEISNKSGVWKSNGTQAGTRLLCSLGASLACEMINPTFKDNGFLNINNSLLFLGFPNGFDGNYGDTELYRTNLTNCPTITVTITGTTSFCQGSSATFMSVATGGTGPYIYQWQRGTEVVGTVASVITVNTAGDYIVAVTDANGCTGIAQVTATQRAVPTISVPPNASFCAGQTTTLTATVTGGTAPFVYSWKQGTTTVGTAAGTLPVNAGGTYTVTVTDASGCASASATTTVTQRPSPGATITASAPGIISGTSVTLTANGGSGLTYQWTRDGQPVSGATQVTYSAQQPGLYAVVVSQNGCSTTAQATAISLITATEEPLTGPDFTLSASPNPTSGSVQVRIVTQPGRTLALVLTMHDLTGRSMWQRLITVSGQHAEALDLSTYPAAMYLLGATSDEQKSSLRLVRQ